MKQIREKFLILKYTDSVCFSLVRSQEIENDFTGNISWTMAKLKGFDRSDQNFRLVFHIRISKA